MKRRMAKMAIECEACGRVGGRLVRLDGRDDGRAGPGLMVCRLCLTSAADDVSAAEHAVRAESARTGVCGCGALGAADDGLCDTCRGSAL